MLLEEDLGMVEDNLGVMEDVLGVMEDDLGVMEDDLVVMEDNLGVMEDDLRGMEERSIVIFPGRFCSIPISEELTKTALNPKFLAAMAARWPLF